MNTKFDGMFLLVFFILAGVLFLVVIVWMIITERRLKRLFMGKKAKDLEETIILLEDSIVQLNTAKEKMEQEIEILHGKLRKSVRGLHTVRFNPFKDQGSNQSFAIGLLNEDGDGVVLSSLYARERMSIFAKPIKGKQSEYELTEEEKEALKNAEV